MDSSFGNAAEKDRVGSRMQIGNEHTFRCEHNSVFYVCLHEVPDKASRVPNPVFGARFSRYGKSQGLIGDISLLLVIGCEFPEIFRSPNRFGSETPARWVRSW